jgi:hypothetical protein
VYQFALSGFLAFFKLYIFFILKNHIVKCMIENYLWNILYYIILYYIILYYITLYYYITLHLMAND